MRMPGGAHECGSKVGVARRDDEYLTQLILMSNLWRKSRFPITLNLAERRDADSVVVWLSVCLCVSSPLEDGLMVVMMMGEWWFNHFGPCYLFSLADAEESTLTSIIIITVFIVIIIYSDARDMQGVSFQYDVCRCIFSVEICIRYVCVSWYPHVHILWWGSCNEEWVF